MNDKHSDVGSYISKVNLRHLFLLLLLVLCAILSYQGWAATVIGFFINDHVLGVANDYLRKSEEMSLDTFEAISGIKIVLDTLSSSQAGISMIVDVKVDLGRMLDVIVDLIDYSWKISLAAVVSIRTLEMVLVLSHYLITPLMTVLFSIYGITYATARHWPAIAHHLRGVARQILLLTLLVVLVVPIAIYFSASLSNFVLAKYSHTSHHEYRVINRRVNAEQFKKGSIHQQVEAVISSLRDGRREGKYDHRQYATLTMDHLAYTVLEYVLLPLLLLVGLGLAVRGILLRLEQLV